MDECITKCQNHMFAVDSEPMALGKVSIKTQIEESWRDKFPPNK